MDMREMRKTLIVVIILTALITVSSGAEFKFAWFTDTHIGSSTAAEDLQAAVADVNRQPDIRFVIISGDVTEQDFGVNLNQAKMLLDELNFPHYVIPGNHDLKWPFGGERYRKLFGQIILISVSGLRLSISSGPLLKMGDGYIAREELSWLDSTLQNLPDKNQRLVFVTHYPMDNSVSNYFDFFRLIEGYNVQALLCGHGHANRISDADGLPQIMSRSTLRARSGTGGYTLVEVDDDSIRFSERLSAGTADKVWATVAIQDRLYKNTGAVESQPDYSQNEKYPFVKVQWTFDAGATVTAATATDGKIVVVGAKDGSCYALSSKTERSYGDFRPKRRCWERL
jgi:predicted phosphohydrolase